MKLKYAKLTFKKDKQWAYVIVKDCETFTKKDSDFGKAGHTGTLIYGSKRKYDNAGDWFFYGKAELVERLDEEWVVRNHFAGLL